MAQKPIYYDGSGYFENQETPGTAPQDQPFEISEDMRKSMGQNPYSVVSEE